MGIEVARSKNGIILSQRQNVLDLLEETGMLGCKAVDTLMDPNQKLNDDLSGEPVDKGRYQRMVGKLIYLSHTGIYLSHTGLDIAFAPSVVS